jgi:hypothetical protein
MLAGAAGQAGEEPDPNFNQTVLLLHGDGTNGAQNNTFLDGSTNNFTITRNGNTTQGTFSPFSLAAGEFSNFFDGSGDFLTFSSSPLALGTSAYTIEFWVYPRTLSASGHHVIAANANNGLVVIIQSTKVSLNQFNVGDVIAYSTPLTTNTWSHVAIVREGTGSNQTKIYINGSLAQTGTDSTNWTVTTNTALGANSASNAQYVDGYVSNFRIVTSAVYTSAFTPSTTPLTAITNTSLLTCQSNRFVDNSTNAFAITRNGDVRVTPFSPFAPSAAYSASVNGGSGYFDGTENYLTVPAGAAFAPGTGDFTIEAWIYPTAGVDRYIWAQTVSGTNYFLFGHTSTTAWIVLTASGGGTQIFGPANSLKLNSWNHVAAARSSGTVTVYVNGAAGTGTTNTTNLSNTTYVPTIGTYTHVTTVNPFTGYMSSLRYVSGTAITPPSGGPTSPLTAVSGTSFLCNFTNAGIFDNTGKNNLETVGNAQIDTGTKKYGTGSMEFDGTGDWLLIPNSPDIQLGTGNFTIEFWIYLNAISAARGFVAKGGASTGWLVSLVSTNEVRFTFTTSTITSTGTLAASTWYHIAVVREGTGSNQTKIYINGTNDGTGTVSTDFNQTESMYVGANRTGGDALNGFIDDLRITKGVARYTGNFAAPSRAFPDL